MASIFAITTAAEDIKAGADGKATVIFTVTNNTNKPVRGIAQAKAMGNTQQEWLDIDGETERDFSARGTQQFTVNFGKSAAPASATTGAPAQPLEKFPFRLDIASALNPDEEFAEGPTVRVEASAPAAPVKKSKFLLWIILAIVAVVILGGGVVAILVISNSGDGAPKFAGTWKMKTAAENRFQFVGTLKIQQTETGTLKASLWKINDADTGAPLMDLTGNIDRKTAVLEGTLDTSKFRLECEFTENGRLSVHSTRQSQPFDGNITVATQILDKE
jgi:hypothetical protein